MKYIKEWGCGTSIRRINIQEVCNKLLVDKFTFSVSLM